MFWKICKIRAFQFVSLLPNWSWKRLLSHIKMSLMLLTPVKPQASVTKSSNFVLLVLLKVKIFDPVFLTNCTFTGAFN
ncbi:hypothetical protein PHET_11411 [Paragonimus heterotremus]|uniref:Uncharacterized protein n=1 Tax=Paragonimus heterotremus TaxID=100268 RepID=A0A8J4SRP5_9TREM|nr:hypothetical protein PHET_11411 [Paragonimus heterotremus]